VAELLFPRLPLANRTEAPNAPAGEVIGNYRFPAKKALSESGIGNG
jgi:alkanesulfonate monooxygenase